MSHLDVTLTSSVGPECVELISIVCRVDLYCSESNLWCVFELIVNTGECLRGSERGFSYLRVALR